MKAGEQLERIEVGYIPCGDHFHVAITAGTRRLRSLNRFDTTAEAIAAGGQVFEAMRADAVAAGDTFIIPGAN